MAFKVGITRFLGTNCDEDVKKWVLSMSMKPSYLWYEDQFNVNEFDFIIIPGGFSHGDYLRCGALAAKAPVMKSVIDFAKKQKPILGICNGFQILCEAQLLPGALLQNESGRFKDQWVDLEIQNNKNYFANKMQIKQKIKLPIAHGDGRYFNEADALKKMLDQQQVWLTYEQNPNGSVLNIAGVFNQTKNVAGLMPHPERALTHWMGSSDGVYFL